jgi:uncharacterized protein (DUF1015 family)
LPEIQPFSGILYRNVELEKVLAPPYDVIPPAYQDELYARHPKNIVRVILNRTSGEAGYTEAGATFKAWQGDGTLAADPEPGLYVLEQRFEWEERPYARTGLLARFRAEDPERGVVLPHEQTRKGPKEDRWRVLLATRANFSPIFLMLPDPGGRFSGLLGTALAGAVAAEFADDGGVAHRLFRVTEESAVRGFQETLAATKAYIADGHHRYATALRYRDEVGPEGAWTLGYFTPMEAPGLLVLPYHRIVSAGPSLEEARRALLGKFLVSEVGDATQAARDAGQSTMPYAFGLAWPEGGALVAEALPEVEDLFEAGAAPSLRALDAYFFHEVVLRKLLGVGDEAVSYVHSLREAEEALANARCRLAALMRGTPVRHVVDVADARESMPAKSTFFHPKLPSGLVIHPLPA